MGGQPQSATVHKTSISPMLSVRNGAKAIEFYKAAFGAAELFRVGDESGVVARLSVGGAEFWVADESPENWGGKCGDRRDAPQFSTPTNALHRRQR